MKNISDTYQFMIVNFKQEETDITINSSCSYRSNRVLRLALKVSWDIRIGSKTYIQISFFENLLLFGLLHGAQISFTVLI